MTDGVEDVAFGGVYVPCPYSHARLKLPLLLRSCDVLRALINSLCLSTIYDYSFFFLHTMSTMA